MKKNNKIIIIACIVLILDIISKIIITNTISLNEDIFVIKNFFSITNVRNTGAAFSIFENNTPFLILTSLICLYIISKMIKEFPKTKLTSLSFGMLLGGLFGNLFDRVFLGYVRDFLSFNIFGYAFPVFNIADSFIVLGTIELLIFSLKDVKKDDSNSK